ncbi:putative TIM-barrel fold metal-dependent hydrolase [Belliella baltica DSM 15883]|uniref:Putative TIM-barrel fold metal-dependent hydrolase n=1 Tax=Belliella baltica (strain DSM 15883 / CIP 108006 / LMG 21964 / BA134) TaxID=866536 RepID=I3Z5U5_BELBD|nr:amidohydrolase [Belliella baltica]AFL84613.1 putative TIM-barrel fold metal-dependent hydrolase [Belliella baltica DSM 15883]
MKKLLLLSTIFISIACLTSCKKEKEKVDLIVHNGTIYTVSEDFDIVNAFAVKDGKFIAVGNNSDILSKYEASQTIDAAGQAIYPGLIDAHAHFYRYGLGLKIVELLGAESEQELIERVIEHHTKNPESPWIMGKGWDQNLWENKEFPTKNQLDELFPDTPVLLTRIDGHAALANQKALDLAGISSKTEMIGGKVILENGRPTGVLIDNAIKLVTAKVPAPSEEESRAALMDAQENCFSVGLTSLVDAGLERNIIELMHQMHQESSLKMRIYAMVNPTDENMAHYFEKGFYQDEYLTVRSFKIYGDGALGSRGAALLQPYHDHNTNYGFLLNTPEAFDELAKKMYDNGFQMNTHCIGDSANRTLLDIYAKYLKGKNDLRWRIEHAQVVSKEDMPKFASYSIIPSVQPTHATSDMPWAGQRLGPFRIKTAYAYKDLLDQNGMIALGSDFPVEHINPMYGFHAAVVRKDARNQPEDGFQIENRISREQALKGMTIWAAFSNFEENLKGSIETGKLADFVFFEKDMMTAPENELRDLKVTGTYIGGMKVY